MVQEGSQRQKTEVVKYTREKRPFSVSPNACMCAHTYVLLCVSVCVQVRTHTCVETRTALNVIP